jgi:hypothetical protein
MPWKSKAQAAWGHSLSGLKALGGEGAVSEWDDATTPGSLPERASMADKPKKWIQGAVKHPGALTAAAKEHGVSKLAEANKESHSSNPHIRARGALGKRFIQHKI